MAKGIVTVAEGDVRVPAGWYPDPLGLPQLRWWDNHAWTEYTSDARQPMVAQETVTQQARLTFADAEDDLPATDAGATLIAEEPVKPTQEALLSLEAPAKEAMVEEELSPAAKFAEFVPSNAPTTPAFDLDTRFDDLLGDALTASRSAFSHVSEASESFVPASAEDSAAVPLAATTTKGSTSTGPAWVIAMTPLYVLLVTMFFLLSHSGGTLQLIVSLVVPYLGSIVLAFFDWKILRERGLAPAHWAFSVLSGPVYLIARFVQLVRRSGRGFGPLLGMLGFAAVNLVAVVAVPGLIISLAPATFAHQAEESITASAKAFGADIIVSCPETVPTIVGDGMICKAKNKASDPIGWGINVSLQRANGWFSWQVDNWGIYSFKQDGQG